MRGDDNLKGDVKESVANLTSVSDNAKVIAKNLESFSTKLNKISENVDKLASDASVTLTKTGTRIDELSKDLGGRLEQLAVILDRFQSVAGKIDKGEGTAGRLINDPKLYESLVDTSQELNLTIQRYKNSADLFVDIGFVSGSVLTHRYVYRVYDRRSGAVITAGETTSWGSLAENLARHIAKSLVAARTGKIQT